MASAKPAIIALLRTIPFVPIVKNVRIIPKTVPSNLINGAFDSIIETIVLHFLFTPALYFTIITFELQITVLHLLAFLYELL